MGSCFQVSVFPDWMLCHSIFLYAHRTEQIITTESSKIQQELSSIITKTCLLYSDLCVVEMNGNDVTTWPLSHMVTNTASDHTNAQTYLASIATPKTTLDSDTGRDDINEENACAQFN